jgi:hypothetical protein
LEKRVLLRRQSLNRVAAANRSGARTWVQGLQACEIETNVAKSIAIELLGEPRR